MQNMPGLRDFKALCPDAVTCAVAMQVYSGLLTEATSNIRPEYEADEAVLYLIRLNTDGRRLVYIPSLHTKQIDFEKVHAIQRKFVNSNIFLAIVDNTGNILYYEVTSGVN